MNLFSSITASKSFLSGIRATPYPVLPPLVIFFALGIAWGKYAPFSETLLVILITMTASAILISYWYRFNSIAFICLLSFFCFIGAIHVRPFITPPASPLHIYNHIEQRQSVTITGTVTQLPTVISYDTTQKTRFIIATKSLQRPNTSTESQLEKKEITGLVRLTLNGLLPPELKPGDEVMVRTLLSRTFNYSTPGSFNYKNFLADQGIWITGWINSPINIIKVNRLPASASRELLLNTPYVTEKIRYRIADFLNRTLPDDIRGLYKAILIGDKSDISPAILENFKAVGCVHILAISGMHVGLLAMLFIGSVSWILKRSTRVILRLPVLKTAMLISLLPLSIYALIAGFNTPVIRALVMTYALITGIFFDRQKSLISNISIAALIILIYQPTSLFAVSTQLSFSAILGIALIFPRISNFLNYTENERNKSSKPHLQQLKTWVIVGLLISLAAFLGTVPLSLYYFNRISLIGPITNLIIEPLVCLWSLVIGLVASIMLPVFPVLSGYLISLGSLGLKLSSWIAFVFADLPFASIWLSTPTIYEIFFYYTLIGCFLFKFDHQKNLNKVRQILALISLSVIVLVPVVIKFAGKISTETKVTALDVGQGSATLLELPHGKTILLDGGGPSSVSFNIGERLIAPFLWKQRINRLDGVIITHPHADHYNGLFFIIEKFKPEILWINGSQGNNSAYSDLLQLAESLSVTILPGKPGATLVESGSSQVKCVSNPFWEKSDTTFYNTQLHKNDINSASLVVKLEHYAKEGNNSFAFLFPGDTNRKGEVELVNRMEKTLSSDVLFSPHHGSNTSNSENFLESVSPDYIIISSGRHSAQINGIKKLENFCKKNGATLLTTPKDGTISFRTNGRFLTSKSL